MIVGVVAEGEKETQEPIRVSIAGTEYDEPVCADFGAWTKVVFAGSAADQAVQILPQDKKRHRAVILVHGVGGTNGVVYVGSMAQAQQRIGGELIHGSSVTVESASAQWINSDGTNAMVVSVLLERYAV